VKNAVLTQDGATYEMVPYVPAKPDPELLKEYEGRYFSPELDMIYTLAVSDSTLMIKLRNTEDIELTVVEKDKFKGEVFFISQVDFLRDNTGKVISFTVSNGRTRGILFERDL
jgi:hypothetical protein